MPRPAPKPRQARRGDPDGLTPAQRAIRRAAQDLENGTIVPPPVVTGVDQVSTPLPDGAPSPPSEGTDDIEAVTTGDVDEPVHRHGAAVSGPLFDLDEIYVGRPAIDQELAYRDRDFNVLATVAPRPVGQSKVEALLAGDDTRHVGESWEVLQDGEPVFSVQRYLPAEHRSYAVFDLAGTPLGAYVCSGGLVRREVVVREAGSAPVAIIRVSHHRHVLTETDGDEVGWCWRAFSGVGDDENEVWGLRIEKLPDLLDHRVLLAAPLVCHLMDNSRRHVDSDCSLAWLLAIAAPPVGLPIVAAERAVDALYWLRRHLD